MKFLKCTTGVILSLILSAMPLASALSEEVIEPITVTDVVEFKVNINSASVEELATLLKGIGPKKAQAIVDFRAANGPFSKIEEIVQVKGIGPSFLAKNETHLTIE